MSSRLPASPRSLPGSAPRRSESVHSVLRLVVAHLRACARIDARSLALFRVSLGTLAIADVLLRSRNFALFYTDHGVVPKSLVTTSLTESFSLFHLTSDPRLHALLFVVHALVALQLVVGYRTRVAAVLTFLFVVSLDHHNPFVLSYADTLFRLLCFWAIFLPLGERWSVDAVLAGREPRAAVAGVATAVAMAQMISMYLINGYHKTRDTYWVDGTAAPLIFGLDEITWFLGDVLRNVPTLLSWGGRLWFALMLVSPLLFLLRGRPRLVLVGLFVGGHAAFAVTVRIGAFPYVAMAGLLLFLQAAFWRDGARTLRLLGLADAVDAAYGDARERGVAIARRFPDVGVDSERVRSIRSFAYSFSVYLVALSFAITVGATGLQFAGIVDDDHGIDEPIDDVADVVGVDQPDWTIFAPSPSTTDRYHVAPALTADGRLVDAYNDRPLTYERPYDQLQRQHDTYRQRFYMNSVRRHAPAGQLSREFMDHLCTSWAEEHDVELTHVNLYVIYEDVTMDTIADHERRDRRSRELLQHTCDDDASPIEIEPPDF